MVPHVWPGDLWASPRAFQGSHGQSNLLSSSEALLAFLTLLPCTYVDFSRTQVTWFHHNRLDAKA